MGASATALHATDQLRQRVAWALSQIFVVHEQATGEKTTEEHVAFYDIFVRHAFGSLRDVLREISYSPLMARYLTFHGNARFDGHTYPDENYAREIMQLFSVGLYRLRLDGTVYVDAAGEPLATYDNDDIMDGARLWTGFALRASRGNLEHYCEASSASAAAHSPPSLPGPRGSRGRPLAARCLVP
mgnify:CR=1 FL=1